MANGWPRRRWTIALAGSLAAHALLSGILRIGQVPSANQDEVTAPIAILRITRSVVAHGPAAVAVQRKPREAPRRLGQRPVAPHPHAAAVPAASAAPRAEPAAPLAAPAGTIAGGSRTGVPVQAGAAASPGPQPSLSPEQLAALNDRMRAALPSAQPETMKRYPAQLERLAIRPEAPKITVATYPLPTGGLFAHARIVRVGNEAVAVRAISRVGRGYLCIGYLAKVDEHGIDASIAGPYAGPCKRAWLPQLGLAAPEPSPAPSDSPSPAP